MTVTRPQEDFCKWPLPQGLDHKDLLLTSKCLVFSVAINPKIICLVITSPFQGNCLPFYPTKPLCFSGTHACRLHSSVSQMHRPRSSVCLPLKVQRRSRGIKCKPDLVISQLKTLLRLPVAHWAMANSLLWLTRPACLAFCPLLPQCLTQRIFQVLGLPGSQ